MKFKSRKKVTDICDEPGCRKRSTCGFPVDDERRYRRTCWEHSKFKLEAEAARTAHAERVRQFELNHDLSLASVPVEHIAAYWKHRIQVAR